MKTVDPEMWLDKLKESIDNVSCCIENMEVPYKEAAEKIKQLLSEILNLGSSVWWVGNGGSAAVCSHLSQDMMNKLGIKSLFLNDTSLMSCMANDFGYENVYARPLTLNVSENDLLIAISSSGNSKNILNAVNVCKKKKMKIIALSGFRADNLLNNTSSDVSLLVRSNLYGIVEVCHEALLHGIIETMWMEQSNQQGGNQG